MITEDDLKLVYKCFYKVVEDYPEIHLKYKYNDIIITTIYEDIVITTSSDSFSFINHPFCHNIQYVKNSIEGQIHIFLLTESLKSIDDFKEEFNIIDFIDDCAYDLVVNNDIRTISNLLYIKEKTFKLYESTVSKNNLNSELSNIIDSKKKEKTRRKM